ncbi:MAG: dihydroorotate dehydrogenase electron transfer subunit [Candidatus Roizmanbacteria bacterium]|nr:dihydroorotate dehydrogenase electron transfer subunit [Candidatus Roizmanbacteria bacterium]
MSIDHPLMLPIKNIVTESPNIKTFIFDYNFYAEPGQFCMIWIPGVDEKPFGIVKREGQDLMITVAAIGHATKALHQMRIGDKVGFRGPYGSSFTIPARRSSIALVAGGYGIASLGYLAEEVRKRDVRVHLFLGARTKKDLLYLEWMKNIGVELHLSTDDGSEGYKGFNTDLFKEYVHRCHPELSTKGRSASGGDSGSKNKTGSPIGVGDDKVRFDKVYTVGPEIMEMKIAKICYANNIPFEVSIERYMKCGFGLCGQCCVDPTGWRMCVEGPVIDGEKLKQITEFGKYHRTASGKVEKYPWFK